MNLFAWLKTRKDAARLAQADADAVILQFGNAFYYEARERAQRSASIDSSRLQRHWTRVKLEIAKRHGIEIGQGCLD
jgi:hypothetical protein